MRQGFLTRIALVTAVLLQICAMPALAIPPLPASFYGAARANGQDVPDGTVVEALIDGKVYARGQTATYTGHSVYGLDVPGDEPDSAQCEGGRQDQSVQFTIAGRQSQPDGTWRSGTNTRVDLSAAVSGPPPSESTTRAARVPLATLAGGAGLILFVGAVVVTGRRRSSRPIQRGNKL